MSCLRKAGVVLLSLVCSVSIRKTAVKYARAERFPESRSDRGRKLSPYLPFLQAQWAAGEQNIALLYQTICTQGYRGSETSVRKYITSLRKEIGPAISNRDDITHLSQERENGSNIRRFRAAKPLGWYCEDLRVFR